jgi:predicted metal-dependent phosphoesterase TrpH
VGSSFRSGPTWYRGDCHVHTIHSDGQLSPAEAASEARAAGLNFIATTDHNTVAAHRVWSEHSGPDLLVIVGLEVTTVAGHWLALGVEPGQLIDWHYDAQANGIGDRLDEVHHVGGLCVAAHPHAPYPSGTFKYPLRGLDAVEVWNGLWASDRPWNADNEAAYADWGRSLVEDVPGGSWRPAIGNSDAHLPDQLGRPHTVVLADDLPSPAILAAVRAGHSWIADSARIEVSFSVTADESRVEIGQHLHTCGQPAAVLATVSGISGGTAAIITDQGPVHTVELRADEPTRIPWTTTAEESTFLRLEVHHPDQQMAALTNPITLS